MINNRGLSYFESTIIKRAFTYSMIFLLAVILFCLLKFGNYNIVIGLILLISFGCIIIYSVAKYGTLPILYFIVFFWWIPFIVPFDRVLPSLGNFYISETCIWLLFFVILIIQIIKKKVIINKQDVLFILPWVIFIVGAIFANFVFAEYNERTMTRFRQLCLIPMLLSFVLYKFVFNKKQAERLLWIYLGSACLLAVIILFMAQQNLQLDMVYVEDYLELLERGRLAKVIKLPLSDYFIFNPETGSLAFSFIASIAFAFFINVRSLLKKLFSFIILILCFAIMIKAQGRAAFLSATVTLFGCVIISLVLKKHTIMQIATRLGSVILILLGMLGGIILHTRTLNDVILIHRVSDLFNNPINMFSLGRRFEFWTNASFILWKKIISGVGLYGLPLSTTGTTWYVHNLFLFLILSFGAIGFVGFLLIVIRYIKNFILFIHLSPNNFEHYGVAGLAICTVLFVGGLVSCIFSKTWEILCFWIPVNLLQLIVVKCNANRQC